MKKYFWKIGAVFMAAVMVACVPVNVNAASMSYNFKGVKVGCGITRSSASMRVTTTAAGATCHSGGQYQLMRTSSGSADPVASMPGKSAQAASTSVENVSSGMTCIYLKGNHSVTIGGETSAIHTQSEGSIRKY